MPKFLFIFWLIEFLQSQCEFIFEWDDTNLLALEEQYQPVIGRAIVGYDSRWQD
jgi:hypothetical protein